MKEKRRQPSTVTLERRTVLQWLGSGTVLALGPGLLSACSSSNSSGSLDGLLRRDGAGADGASIDFPAVGDGGFPFAPHTDETVPPFDKWPERTVDKQDLQQILASWQLTVDGLVDAPRTFSFAELLQLPRQDQITDFHCVEGWSVLDVPWSGIGLGTLLDLVKARSEATYVVFHTIESAYNGSLPIEVAREPKTMLGYGAAGYTLPLSHGFPLRVVAPRLLGYKNPKYVQRIELTTSKVESFWVKAGYGYAGEVPPERLRPGKY